MNKRQVELNMQSHIIDSYKLVGGYAKKWASGWQVGNPDLICALGRWGTHLLEVKHMPDFGPGKTIKNALDKKQAYEAECWNNAGGFAVAAIVGCSDKAVGSKLIFLNPAKDEWNWNDDAAVPYVVGTKYDITRLLGINT